MTMPSLIANKEKKELQTGLKKYYSVLSNALIMMSNDLGEPVLPNDYAGQTFVLSYKNYLNVMAYCGMENCVGMSTSDEDETIKDVIKNYRTYDKSKNVQTYYFDDGQIVLNDGAFIIVENPAADIINRQVFLTVDVNGYKKRPNIWGQDLFTFRLTKDGKLLPMGAEGTGFTDEIYCSNSSTNPLNGIGCTQKALTDKTYWKTLP